MYGINKILSKNIFCIFAVFLVLLSVSCVSAEDMLETGDVSAINADEMPVRGSSIQVNDWDDLKAGVGNESVDEIVFNGAGAVPASQISFNHDLTIIGGSGSYIGNSNLENITSYSFIPFISTSNSNVRLVNMSFRNMNNEILFKLGGNGNYTFENCVFENVNATTGKRSVIWLETGVGLIDKCRFVNCTTQYGTVTNYHDSDVNAVHLTVKDSFFGDNYAGTSSGAINNCGQMTVVNSTFWHNRAGWWAGAVHTHIGANSTIRKSRFIENLAGWNGGAAYTYSTLTLVDCDFIGNNCTTNYGGGAIGALAYWGQTPPVMTVINCNFTDNVNKESSSGRGGAISFSGGKLDVYSTYFRGNDAKYGTAISAVNLVDSNIVNNTFIDNTGVINGSDTLALTGSYNIENNSYSDGTPMDINIVLKAKFTFGNSVDCNIKTTSVYRDYIKTASYEVFVDDISYLNTTSNTFSVVVNDNNKHIVRVVLKGRNKTDNVTIPLDAIYVSTNGSSNGDGSALNPFNNIYDAIGALSDNLGTIIVNEGTYYLSSSKTVSKNFDIIGRGNVVFDGSSLSANYLFSLRNGDYSFESITFTNFNKPILHQGTSYSPVVELINCTFRDNDISNHMIFAYSIIVKNSKFINNNVFDGLFYFNKDDSSLNCTDSIFINNRASANGAVLYGNKLGVADISGCLFVNNSAYDGAVIYIGSSSAHVNVEDCVFLNNVASGDANIISSNSPVDANANWWGNTEYDYSVAPAVSSSVTVNTWLFLNETHNKISQNAETINLILKKYNSVSGIISNYEVNNLPDVDMNVSIDNGAESISNICLTEGIVSFNVYNLTINNYTVYIGYWGNNYSFTFSFLESNKLNPYLIVRVKDMIVGDNATIVINMPVSATGNVVINVNGVNTTVPIVNGLISTQIPTLNNLQNIVYNILVNYEGDNNYYAASNSTFFMLCDDGSQWAMSTFDSKNTGKVPYSGMTGLNNIKWSAQIGGNISNIVVDSQGNVYVSNGTVIFAFDSEGRVLWEYGVEGYSLFTGLAISHDVIIATREGYSIYFINRFTGKDYSTANIWQGSSLFAPTVDEKGTIYISGEYQNDTGTYIVTIIPYDTWMFGDEITVVDIGNHSPVEPPVCTYDGIICVNTVDGLIFVVEGYADDHLLGLDSPCLPVKSSYYDRVYTLLDGYLRVLDPSGSSIDGVLCDGYYLALDEINNKIYVLNDSHITVFNSWTLNASDSFKIKNNYTSILIDDDGNIYGISDSNNAYLINLSNDLDDPFAFDICGGIVMNSNGEILVHDENGNIYCINNANRAYSFDNKDLLGISLSEVEENVIIENSLSRSSSNDLLADSITNESMDEYTWDFLINYIVRIVSYDEYAWHYISENDFDYEHNYLTNPDADYPTVDDFNESCNVITIPRGKYIPEIHNKYGNYLIFKSFAEAYCFNGYEWFITEDVYFPVIYDGNNSIIDAVVPGVEYPCQRFMRAFNDEYNGLVNTTLKNFIFCNLPYSSYFLSQAKYVYNLTFINCSFVNCRFLFDLPNLHLINCSFINCPTGFENINGEIYVSGLDLYSLILCNENNSIENCSFISNAGSMPMISILNNNNAVIKNNFFNCTAPYVLAVRLFLSPNFIFEGNYIISNHKKFNFTKIIAESSHNSTKYEFSSDGTIKYGNGGIWIIGDKKVDSFSLGQYALKYYNNTNYPYKTDISASIEGSDLIFTLDDLDNGILTLGNGTVVSISDGGGSVPLSVSPGWLVEVTISGYVGEKYYSLGSDYSLTVPRLSPNLNINADELVFAYNNPIEISIDLEPDNNANVSIYDKFGRLVDSRLTKNIATFDNLSAGEYVLKVTYSGDESYLNESITVPLTITPITSELTLNVVNTTATLVISISTNIDENVIINVNGDKFTLNNFNTSFTLNNLPEGKYYVTASFVGNTNYTNVSDDKIVTLSRIDSNLEVFASVVDNIVSISSTLAPSEGNITYIVNNKQYTKAIGENLVLNDLTPNSYSIFASYAGDIIYRASSASNTFVIADKTKNNPDLDLFVENSIIKVTLNENATGNVLITVGDISFIRDASFIIIDASEYLSDGTYTVKVTYGGDEGFINASITGSVVVPENIIELLDPKLSVVVVNTTIIVTANNMVTGTVLVDVGGKGFYAKLVDAKASIDVDGIEAGTYKATVTYLGDEKYFEVSKSLDIAVPKEEMPVENNTQVNPKVDIKVTDETIDVTLPDDASGYILVDINGNGYYAQVKSGKANVKLPELAHGNHTVNVIYTGDSKYRPTSTTGTVLIEKPNKTIMSEDLIKVEKGSQRFGANFTDAKGNALAGKNVTFEVGGITYTRTTNVNGRATIPMGLIPGNYTVTITNPETGEVKTNKITILQRIIENRNVEMFYRNGSQYSVRILDDNGNPVAGEIVTFNINGVMYERKSNANGYAKLNLRLNPAEYIVTAEYKGCKASNIIKIKSVLSANDLTKKFGTPDQFQVRLVDGQGKPYANQVISFNIHGILYERTTNADGIAKLNIRLQAGQYLITSTYNGLSMSNWVTVTV